MLFDTHAHLDDKRFDEDRDELIRGLPEMGISLCLNAGTEMSTSREAIKLAEEYPFIYASVGVHPHVAQSMTEEDMLKLREWSRHPKVKAIGEIGLDYYYDRSPREIQREWFDRQMDLAFEEKLPVIIHDRDAHGDLLGMLRARKNRMPQGVLHCFSGSWEMARECLDFGFYISFAGPLTFKNAAKLPEVASRVPEDRLLIETDSPYLAPVPHRGKRNNPSFVRHVAEKLAEIRQIPFTDICRITMENGMRLFGIDDL